MMKRLVWLAALLLGIALAVGCSKVENANDSDEGSSGGDGDGGTASSGDGDGDGDSSSSGGDGDGDSSSSGGDGDGDTDSTGDTGGDYDAGMFANVDGGIPCGGTWCAPDACCADPFVSICGAPIGARGCIMPPEMDASSDPRCPELNIMGFFTLPSCCTEDNECGIDATNFGTGCIENGRFAELASMMAGGGVSLDTFPAPQACE